MKSKFAVVVMLTAICMSFVVSGVTGARQSNPDFAVYLPLVTKPYCTPRVTAYVSTSDPVVRVGEIMTLTGSIVNECSQLGR